MIVHKFFRQWMAVNVRRPQYDQNMGLHVIPHYLALRPMARFLQALGHAA